MRFEKKYFFIHPTLLEISWPAEISEEILLEQQAWKLHLQIKISENIEEIRFGFQKLSVSLYHPMLIAEWDFLFQELLTLKPSWNNNASKCWKIPVCYDPVFGKDLSFVAKSNGISEMDVVNIHLTNTYRLHFYGFLPGFMYLGGLDPTLHTHRKATPDRLVKSGSVAIGGRQTGIYPSDSPGGWQVIGRSPLRFFNIKKPIPVIPQVGDRVKFFQISLEEYQALEQVQDFYEWKHD